MQLLLGLDIGTSSTKGILLDHSGQSVAVASHPYPLHQPHPGWSEQDPADWWNAVVHVTRSLVAAARDANATIAAVGFSGQMHGSVLLSQDALDSQGSSPHTLRRAILWNDQRTAPQAAHIESLLGGRRAIVNASGNAALPGFTAPKLLWIRQHEPRTFDLAAQLLTPKDYIRWRLTGIPAIDAGDASGTLLLDIRTRRWNLPLLHQLNLPQHLLPPVLESAAPAGTITPWAAAQTGLNPGIPVAAGTGDNMAAAIACGAVRSGVTACVLGTSGVIIAHTDQPVLDLPADPSIAPGRFHAMCAATGDARTIGGWCNTGCLLSAGGALAWTRSVLAPDLSFDQLMHEAAHIPPGAEGLFFLPHLTGERCPHPDPFARGAWIGLTSRHTRAHLVRAVIEGVAFSLAHIAEMIRSNAPRPAELRLTGGGAQSPLFRSILADAFDADIAILNTEEGPALGAAILAGVALGVWPSVPEACDTLIHETDRTTPHPDRARRYASLATRFRALYPSLRPHFRSIDADNADE